MKILMITDVYFPRINGVSTSIMTFRKNLKEAGHEVTLLAPAYEGHVEMEDDIIRIPSRGLIVDEEDRMMKYGEIMSNEQMLKDRGFDIVHIQTPFVAHYAGTQLSKKLGIPRIESYHTFFEEYLYHYIKFLPKALLRFAARRFSKSQCNDLDGLIVPSTAMREVLHNYGIQSRTEIVPTGLDLPLFEAGNGKNFRDKHHIDRDRPLLVHIGRVAYEKNIDFLLRTLVHVREEVPNVLLVIAGEGPAVEHLKKLTDSLKLETNVYFVGYLDRKTELLDCYRAGDLFVFASRTETQGLVLLEAMACGTPVVSTAVMGTKDILRDEKGAIIAEEDELDFAENVIMVLNDPEMRQRLSVEAKRFVQSWSNDSMNTRLVNFYSTVISEKIDQKAGESIADIISVADERSGR